MKLATEPQSPDRLRPVDGLAWLRAAVDPAIVPPRSPPGRASAVSQSER